MSLEAAVAWADALVFRHSGAHLTELQLTILQQVWQGKRYIDIANYYGCTEGHAKDIGADLWKLLSATSGEKVSKRTFPLVVQQHIQTSTPTFSTPSEATTAIQSFVGRSQDIADLHHLETSGMRAILLQGEGGIGKTTLAQTYLRSSFKHVLEVLIAKDPEHVVSVESIVEEWLRRDFDEEPGRDLSVTLSRLKRHLQSQRTGILIDNLEPALDQAGCLRAEHRSYVELLRVLTDPSNQSLTIITSRDRLCEDGITVEHYRLSGLSVQAWQDYWDNLAINSEQSTRAAIHHTYGGNAKAMRILAGMIREDFGNDAQSFWQEASQEPLQSITLKNLVSGQLDRLLLLDHTAYHLLCRLACYRFQDQPRIPRESLTILLWDIEPSRHTQVIQSIRNRSLVEFHGGEYWLHPVIREEAIARLKSGNDWEKVTRKIAQFWQHRVSVITHLDEALTVWEAFYHYVEIQDYDAASQVILQPHLNQWQQYLPLGSLLYRMGLSNLVLTAIHQILPHVKVQSNISELNNILGDLYWITGQLSDAIAYQERARIQAKESLAVLPQDPEVKDSPSHQHQIYYLRMLEIDSLFSLGLYHLNLWALSQASILFQQVIDISQQTKHERWAEKASICLALIESYQGHPESVTRIQSIVNNVRSAKSPAYTGPFAYFIRQLGQIYTNIGQFKQAKRLYQKAIAYAHASQYTQVTALAKTGLAELSRLNQNYDQALIQHQEAVHLLEDIGATCDLAESYLQWGLTLQKMQQDASTQFEKAIGIYHKIGAPLQVLRIQSLKQD